MIAACDFDPTVDDHREVAQLLELANPDFYDGIRLEPDARRELLASLIAIRGTDLEPVRVIRLDGHVAGMWCGLFPVAQLAGRQLKLLTLLAKRLDRPAWLGLQQHCASYASNLPAPPPDTLYLSRIAVAEPARGRGLGRTLIDDFIATGRGTPITLHVRADNAPAIHAYEQAGFIRQPGDSRFALMTRRS